MSYICKVDENCSYAVDGHMDLSSLSPPALIGQAWKTNLNFG